MKWFGVALLLCAVPVWGQSRGWTDEWGINVVVIGGGRNFNDHFSLGVESTLATFNYRDAEGDMESLALRVNATWNLLAGPLTPFVSGAAGVIFLDPNLGSDPPAGGCWSYPWYGEACSDRAPRTVGGEWIAIPEATSTVGYLVLRADFGIPF